MTILHTPMHTIAEPRRVCTIAGDSNESTEGGTLACEVEAARQVQQRLFPLALPAIAGLDYCGLWRAARSVSGDYLDYFALPGGNLGLAIGDVAGKGLPAALLMSTLHGMVRALGLVRRGSLQRVMRTLNRLFFRVSPDNCFASLFLGRYDPVQQRLHFVNAGHEPPFVLRRDGSRWRTIPLEPGGPVIGMRHGHSYREGVVTLAAGDVLVAYTDGVSDVLNPQGEEWGSARLLRTVQEYADSSAEEIAAHVMEEADAFAGAAPQQDDMTLCVARVRTAQRCPESETMLLEATAA